MVSELYNYFKECRKISTDSRQDVKDSLFFALSGDNFNGNRFAESALQKGARLAVIDDKDFDKGEGYFLVENALGTLQKLALFHRDQMPMPVIGITGSNGKTTTKELISAVLSSKYNVVATLGNFNNHIGLPITVLRFDENTDIGITEMGANHPGEIETLCKISKPDFGIITNIGKAHLEGFGSFEGVIKTKNELYQYLQSNKGMAIVNNEDELLMSLSDKISRLTYGGADSEISGEIISAIPTLKVRWHYDNKHFICQTQLYGRYNYTNIMAAISFGVLFKVSPEKINQAIESYTNENNRSQLIETAKNKIVLDAYNANPVSMQEALRSFNEMQYDNPWLILGDMFELGEYSAEEHENILNLLQNLEFKNVILTGKDFHSLSTLHNYLSFETTDEALRYLKETPIQNANILLKGSRGMKLERLIVGL